jgi:hypothetical protein
MKLAENSCFVLGVTAEASRIEVEREAQKDGLRLGRARSGSGCDGSAGEAR